MQKPRLMQSCLINADKGGGGKDKWADDDGWGDASFVRTPQVRGGNGGHDLDGDNDDDDEERDAAEEAE